MTCISHHLVWRFSQGLTSVLAYCIARCSRTSQQHERQNICLGTRLLFLLPGTTLFAQQAPDVFSGGPDVLYAQSQLLRSIDQFWFAPLSPCIPVAPLAASSPTYPFPVFPKDNSASRSSTSNILVNPQDTKTRKEATGHFRWLPAIGESLLYTGIMHTFDLATQAGIRDSLNGHWFQQYTRSVSELRGSWLRMWAILWKVRSSDSLSARMTPDTASSSGATAENIG